MPLFTQLKVVIVACCSALTISACSITAISPQANNPTTPDQWQTSKANLTSVREAWLEDMAEPQLIPLINEALQNNYQLAQQLALLDESRHALTISGADRFPELSLSADGSRRKNSINNLPNNPSNINLSNSEIIEQYNASLDLSWELDVWGKLSDNQKRAKLAYNASAANVEATKQALTANIATTWYRVIQAQQLLNVLQQRLANLKIIYQTIENAYKLGSSDLLDMYLSKANLAQQQSNNASQKQALVEAIADLQLLLARYPDGQWKLDASTPSFDETVPVGQPSELLLRRPDIQQAWFNLLASDAALAVAHKQRFPSLRLLASTSDNSNELNKLLDGGSLAWSLLGGLTQPLFAGGRLAAAEKQARSRVVQAEKRYLEVVYNAFAEVETTISRSSILNQQYDSLLEAQKNSDEAYNLSLEQYKRGLISYVEVLEAQRRAFDTQNQVIQLRFQKIQNRIALHLSLGGGFIN